MPDTPLSKVPYPSGSDAPAAAADMMAAFMSMDDRLILKAVDEADRDSKYADAPTGSFCVSGESKMVWFKTGPGPTEWFTLYADTGWVKEGFVAYAGWEVSSIQARRVGDDVEVRGEMVRTGDELIATNSGHLANVDVVTVPPVFRPSYDTPWVSGLGKTSLTHGTVDLYPSGRLALCDLLPNSALPNGEYLRMSIRYFAG